MRQLRRSTILSGAGATFASVGIVRGRAQAAQFTYKAAHDLPPSDLFSVRALQMWTAIEAQTQGRLVVRSFPDSQLGTTTSMFSQLRSGALEFMFNSGAQFGDVVPATALESVGFAFKDTDAGLDAMDGVLGAYIRKQIEAANIVVMPRIWGYGMRQVANNARAIHTASDLEGVKVRTPPSKIYVDLFQTLGASPSPVALAELYAGLQTHLVDGCEMQLPIMESLHLPEVQRYLSMTNHIWGGKWMIANPAAWQALPPDIQDIVRRNAAKYALLQRRDYALYTVAVRDKLAREGMHVNDVDQTTFRARLGAYYARWKASFGPAAWGALESAVGPLG